MIKKIKEAYLKSALQSGKLKMRVEKFFINSKTGQISFSISIRELRQLLRLGKKGKIIDTNIRPAHAVVYFELKK